MDVKWTRGSSGITLGRLGDIYLGVAGNRGDWSWQVWKLGGTVQHGCAFNKRAAQAAAVRTAQEWEA